MSIENIQDPVSQPFTQSEIHQLRRLVTRRRYLMGAMILSLVLFTIFILVTVFIHSSLLGSMISAGILFFLDIILFVVYSIKICRLLKGRPLPNFRPSTALTGCLRSYENLCSRLENCFRSCTSCGRAAPAPIREPEPQPQPQPRPQLPLVLVVVEPPHIHLPQESYPLDIFSTRPLLPLATDDNDFIPGTLPTTLDETIIYVEQMINVEWNKNYSYIPQAMSISGFKGQRTHHTLKVISHLFACPFSLSNIARTDRQSLLEHLLDSSGLDAPSPYATAADRYHQTALIFIPESDIGPTPTDALSTKVYGQEGGIAAFFQYTIADEYELPESTLFPEPNQVISTNLARYGSAGSLFPAGSGFSQLIAGTVPSSSRNPTMTLTQAYRSFYQIYTEAIDKVLPGKTGIVLTIPGFNYHNTGVDTSPITARCQVNPRLSPAISIGDEVCYAAALQAIKDACYRNPILSRCWFQLLFNATEAALFM
ncbi:MAG: hypothetical protein RRZ72_00210 [Victivallaceae bacterium]